jgi:hypothetical protein
LVNLDNVCSHEKLGGMSYATVWVRAGLFDGVVPTAPSAPWMNAMFVGRLDSNQSGIFPGWAPIRDERSKW